jgi:Spy/CpxP family protein refolding chaperone
MASTRLESAATARTSRRVRTSVRARKPDARKLVECVSRNRSVDGQPLPKKARIVMPRRALCRIVSGLVLVSLALPLRAQDRLSVVAADRAGEGARRFGPLLRCLSILDLTDQQKADIRAILEAAKASLQTDADAVRTARQKLQEDLNGASIDPCVIGQDFLALHGNLEKLRADLASVRGQIEAKLRADQIAKLEGCLQAVLATAGAEAEDSAE